MSDDAKSTVVNSIRSLLKRRKGVDVVFDENANLYDDLEMDSLEVAEFSAVLEDDLGRDPYSAGETPRTVGEVIKFFET